MNWKTNKTLRILIKCVIAVLVVVALLYFVPWPTRIDQRMTGAEVSADGIVLQECTVTVKGWKLNYLFKENQIKFETFQIDNPNLNLPSGKYDSLSANVSDDFLVASGIWGDMHTSQYVLAFLANDNSWIYFRTNDRYFAVSVEGGLSPEAIWETVTSEVNFKQ